LIDQLDARTPGGGDVAEGDAPTIRQDRSIDAVEDEGVAERSDKDEEDLRRGKIHKKSRGRQAGERRPQ
jgi:hypothetical protein